MPETEKFIIINRGFSGKYLEDHLGHEMINFLSDDEGRQWCFINKNGKLHHSKGYKVEWVFNTILIRRGVFEVLNAMSVSGGYLELFENTPKGGVRLVDKHVEYVKEQNIYFAGASHHDIYPHDGVITFRANKVYLPQKRIVLTHEDLSGDPLECDAFHLEMFNKKTGEPKQLGNQSARTYVRKADEAYQLLISLLSNEELFKEGQQPKAEDVLHGRPMSFCECDGDLVDLETYYQQKQLFFHRIQELPF